MKESYVLKYKREEKALIEFFQFIKEIHYYIIVTENNAISDDDHREIEKKHQSVIK